MDATPTRSVREVFKPMAGLSFLGWSGLDSLLCPVTYCAGDQGVEDVRMSTPLPPPRAAERLSRHFLADEVCRLVNDFCQDVPKLGTRVAPSSVELLQLWVQVGSRLRRAEATPLNQMEKEEAVADIIHENFMEGTWQVQLRCLHVVLYFHNRGAAGRAVTKAFLCKARSTVARIASTEGMVCRKDAAKLLALVRAQDEREASADEVFLENDTHEVLSDSLLHFEGAAGDGTGKQLWAPKKQDFIVEDLVDLTMESPKRADDQPEKAVSAIGASLLVNESWRREAQRGGTYRSKCFSLPEELAIVFRSEEQATLSPESSAEHFDIGAGDLCRENSELERMFAFKAEQGLLKASKC